LSFGVSRLALLRALIVAAGYRQGLYFKSLVAAGICSVEVRSASRTHFDITYDDGMLRFGAYLGSDSCLSTSKRVVAPVGTGQLCWW
jgi:hypothetical protein